MNAAPEVLSLATNSLTLDLAPGLGGSIAALRWRHANGSWIDLLRPADEAALGRGSAEGLGCFPLTPFSNRLRAGRFEFQGKQIALPRNTSGPHVEHGHGWQKPWQAVDVADDRATLRLTHLPDAWPFAYVMEQRFRLRPAGLEIELVARNDDRFAMPFGFGLHPYFPRTANCRLTAAVSGYWETDGEVMPTRLVTPPADRDPTTGLMVGAKALDNAFTGWTGRAVIEWPEYATRLTLSASEPLRILVIYTPPEEKFFCAEPVSNCTDAFNLAAEREDTGMLVLEPGKSVSARLLLSAGELLD